MISSRSPLIALVLLAGLAAPVACTKPVPPAPVVVAPPPPPPPDPLAERPAIAPPGTFVPPTPDAVTLSNGASLWVVPRPGLPLVSIQLHVPGGSATDPAGHEGAAWLADRLMTQGAGALDAAAFSATVERLGIQLDVQTGVDGSTISLSMQKDQLRDALGLLSDMVLRPHWGQADFKRERDLAVAALTQAQDDPMDAASRVAQSLWYGPKHPWGHPAEGTVVGMGRVTSKDAQRYHALAWNAAGASFTVAGDITRPEAQAALETVLGKPWAAGKAAAVKAAPAVPVADRPLYILDVPDSSQTLFYVLFPGHGLGDARLLPLRAGTIVLGGTFTSRLNALLREKRGFTYGAKARVLPRHGDGAVVVYSRIRTDVTGPAMVDLLGELTSIRQGVTPDELGKAKGAYQLDQVAAMESRSAVASVFSMYQTAGLGPAQLAADLTAMGAVGTEAVQAEMSAYDASKALFVLVGDRARIEPGLRQAGFARIEAVEPL